jgi:general secretion pathway protein G
LKDIKMKYGMKIILGITLFLLLTAGSCRKRVISERWDFTKAKIGVIEASIDAYKLHIGENPKTLDYLLICPRGLEDKWAGPYLKEKQLIDPWGYEYIYHPVGTFNPGSYDIISYGKDGKPGGKGNNADISND